jgi:ATP-dependent Lhr-like helicase
MMQRAGRSGHRPGETSRITFVPTHAFELIELAALRKAVAHGFVEPRLPLELPLDVLSQHLVTIALGGGFQREEMFEELHDTYAFRNLMEGHFEEVLDFITRGGPTLKAYPEYSRVKVEGGLFKVVAKEVARRHRMTIGTITSDASIEVRYLNGKRLGTLEEAFVSRLQMGDRFVFAGQTLQTVRMKDMALWVRKAMGGKGPIPQWLGGRMPLSTELGQAVREALSGTRRRRNHGPEIRAVRPILDLQAKWSHVPNEEELLVETLRSREGYHVFFYPFEGQLLHEGLAALLAYRLSRLMPVTLSLSANDYGFELLSDKEFMFDEDQVRRLCRAGGLLQDILESVNASEMAKRQFRDIARIAGLVFQGYPNRRKPFTQVQASTSLLFNVFQRYDLANFLLKQAVQEVLDRHLEVRRLEQTLRRMASCDIRILETPHPTPMAFPIMVNRLRARVSTETLAERIRRMALRLEKTAERGHP